ncbi:MAG: M28 family peptidase [Vicinamibacteraceae bacterium]|nr:M28 family peptidase [Vicinamibacteraceae bacterium]
MHRRALLALVVLAVAHGPAASQVSTGPGPASVRDRLRADLEFLCAPPLEGRASLTAGADAAAWFLASEFRKIGLAPANGDAYLQRFDLVPLDLARDRTLVQVIHRGRETRFEPNAVFLPEPTRPVNLALDVAFAGFGITAPELGYDDYAGIDVRGKAVLVFDHEPQEHDPASVFNGTGFTLHANAWSKTRNAERHGAAAVLLVTEPATMHRSAPRAPGRANAPPQALARSELGIPRFTVPPAAAEALLAGTGRDGAAWQAEIERSLSPVSRALDGVRVVLSAENRVKTARASWNVAGLLPGQDPTLRDETILVTAHYDHLGVQRGRLYAGANDNASGTAALVEVARRLAGRPQPRSILFVAFGSEEQLMLGSYHYVAHPLRPLATTRAVLNLDMIGRPEAHTPESEGAYEITAARSGELNLVGAVYSRTAAAALQRAAPRAGMTLSDKFDRDSSMRALFRCDHLPFLQKDVEAVWLFGGFHPGYHEPADTIDRLDFEKMERVVALTVYAAEDLAGR